MKLDFTQQYDVAVFGAGIGGIASAIAAARRGHKVCLVEKQTQIGGLATSGMIFIYLPLCLRRSKCSKANMTLIFNLVK